MKHFVMLASEGTQWDELSAEEQQADLERLEQFDQVCAAREGVEIVAAEALDSGSTSTTVRISQGAELPDERLQLVLLCCHPALEPAARSALALRLVIGTPTAEIARLFLVPPGTMAARLTRAKRKIVAAGIPLVLPVEKELATRIDADTRTIYLAFTAGYAPGNGSELLRTQEAGDAVRLAATLHELLPRTPQVQARTGPVGTPKRSTRRSGCSTRSPPRPGTPRSSGCKLSRPANTRSRPPPPPPIGRRSPRSKRCSTRTTATTLSAPTSPDAPAIRQPRVPPTSVPSPSAATASNDPSSADNSEPR